MLAAQPVAGSVTALDVVTLGIAVTGLVVAVVGLTWQVVQHRLTGSVVRAELLVGAIGPGGTAVGPPKSVDQLPMMREQGLDEAVIAVRGRNVGRLAVDVTHWEVGAGDGLSFSLPGYGRNPALQHRLEPGAVVTFYCPMARVKTMLDVKAELGRTDRRVRAVLTLGTGKQVQSDWERFL